MTDPLFDLSGKIALVTGGSRGLGYQMVKAFAERGADCVIASRKLDNCEAVAEKVRSLGRRALAVQVHAAKWDSIDALIETVYAEFGRIDILVNNAGMSPAMPSHEVTEQLFDSVLGLNFKGPFRLASQVAKRMADGDGGVIINVTSGAGTRGSPYTGPYAAAKAGLINLTQTLALELAERGIRVNAVSPGPVVTEAFLEVLGVENRLDELTRTIPLGRTGTPDDIAAMVLFLCSPAASWITGEHHLVAGGRTQRSYQYRPKQSEET